MNQMGRASSSSVFPSLCFLLFLALCHTLVPADGAAPPQEDSKGEPKEPVPQSSGWSRSVVQGLRDLIDSQPHLRQFTLEARNWHSLPAAGGGRNCTNNETCHHGTCVMPNATDASYGHCVCNAGYMGDSCEHEQKSLSTAFTLSFLLGNIGADRLYMGYVGSGVAKLLINLFLCIFPCCPLCYMCRSLSGGRRVSVAYGVTVSAILVSACAVWLWWIVDWALIVTDALPDSSGYPLFDDL